MPNLQAKALSVYSLLEAFKKGIEQAIREMQREQKRQQQIKVKGKKKSHRHQWENRKVIHK
jgi:hypothetical protein